MLSISTEKENEIIPVPSISLSHHLLLLLLLPIYFGLVWNSYCMTSQGYMTHLQSVVLTSSYHYFQRISHCS